MKINHRNGFSRQDLLAVVGMMAVLAGLWLPALAHANSKGDRIACLSNLRRLIQAWDLYSQDNAGRLVMNFHGGESIGGSTAINNPYNAPWALGWMDWTARGDVTNIDYLVNEKYGKLAKYADRDPRIFRCPVDTFVSTPQKLSGWTHRARSVSMQIGVGDGNGESGPWNSGMYAHVKQIHQFRSPGPAKTFVFLDENPDSINDPGYFSPQSASMWMDQPASHHDGAGAFAFADGRAEHHPWAASLAAPEAQRIQFLATSTARNVQTNDADIRWVNYHSPRISAKSF